MSDLIVRVTATVVDQAGNVIGGSERVVNISQIDRELAEMRQRTRESRIMLIVGMWVGLVGYFVAMWWVK